MHLEILRETRQYADTLQTLNRDNRITNEEDLFYADCAVLTNAPNLLAIEGNHERRMLAIQAPARPSVSKSTNESSITITSPTSEAAKSHITPSTSSNQYFPVLHESQSEDEEPLNSYQPEKRLDEETIEQLSQQTQSQLSICNRNLNDSSEGYLVEEDELIENDPIHNTTHDESSQLDDFVLSDSRGKKRKAADEDEAEDDDSENDCLLVEAEKCLEKSRGSDLFDITNSKLTPMPVLPISSDMNQDRYIQQASTDNAITIIGKSGRGDSNLSKQNKRQRLQDRQEDVVYCIKCYALVEW